MRLALFNRRRWRSLGVFAYRALHIVVPATLIVFVVTAVGASEVLSRLRSLDLVWVAASFAACTAQVILSSLRWRLTAERLGVGISTIGSIAEYYFSSLINTTVPGGVVGDAVRAVRSRTAAGLETAAQAVVIERLAGQVALGGTLLVGLALSGIPQLQFVAALAAIGLAAVVVLARVSRGLVLDRLLPGMPKRFVAAMGQSWFSTGALRPQIMLSLLIVVANLAAFAFAARSTGEVIGFPDVLFAVPLILAAMLIPLSVAGWGYREGAAAAVFPLIGASAGAGVSTSVIYGVVVLLASMPGLVVVFLRRNAAFRQVGQDMRLRHETGE